MNVLIVNTSESNGGAAMAADRLKEALNNNGVRAMMLVKDKQSDDPTVKQLPNYWRRVWNFLWERWRIFVCLHFRKEHLWDVDTGFCGTDITRLPEFLSADIIHLSWINQGMLSLRDVKKILDSGKPVVWTMHDIWPATGICHLAMDCSRYTVECSSCPYLPHHNRGVRDLSTRIFNRKKEIYRRGSLTFVACSEWLAAQAGKSALLRGRRVLNIPNPIDTSVFKKTSKDVARKQLSLPTDKRLILFVAQKATNINKGMRFLVEACKILIAQKPSYRTNAAVVILGSNASEFAQEFEMPVFPMGYIGDAATIVGIYNACDVFVLPSLSENLPNTIMEAMACGVPCLGFDVGGIPEEIDHRINGYVAKTRDSEDLARGLSWILDNEDYASLSAAAIKKATSCYSPRSVAEKYTNLYKSLIDNMQK